MQVKLQVTFLLVLFLLVASADAAASRTWTPGVAAGDFFYYDMYGVYTSNQPNVTIAIPQFEYNNTDWTRINMTGVEGSVVYQLYTMHFKNGSETNFSFKSDTNPANMSSLKFTDKGVPLCAANLGVGDTVPTDQILIDETVSRNYAGGTRETNHASWNSTNDWGDLYFDKQTGVLVELCRTHKFQGNDSQIVEKTDVIKITSTNRWQVTEGIQQTLPLLLPALIMVIFAILLFVVVTYRFARRNIRDRKRSGETRLIEK